MYLATDLAQHTHVALKLLREEVSMGVARERFLREIRYATQLKHPNLIPIIESGEDGGALYCVMPCIDGLTLSQLIQREKQLTVDRAVSIATQIAGALALVHAHGIVHRDIKPGNIVFDGDKPMLTDFGIARAVEHSAQSDSLTRSGVQIGTPAYMSPEQGSADRTDARSDIYSLGCVLYEMLTGSPPFTGSTTAAVAARHAVDDVPPLRTVRRSVPAHVDAAVLRALEKSPADRFQSADEFAAALNDDSSAHAAVLARQWRHWRRSPWRIGATAAGLLAITAVAPPIAGWYKTARARDTTRELEARADTARYVFLPMQTLGTVPGADALEQLLHDAIARWSGVALVDEFQVRDALARGDRDPSQDEVRHVALRLGAGRYVRGSFSAGGDSIRVHAVLFDAVGRTQLREAVRRIHHDHAGADSVIKALADELLFRDGPRRGLVEAEIGTVSLPARQSFRRGLMAIEEWNLTAADSQFSRAAAFDPEYAQAHLWLTQVRFWSRQPVARWEYAVQAAERTRARLSVRDQALAEALTAYGAGDAPRACQLFSELTRSAPSDFAVWYGSGMCQILDDAVVRARDSPTGWRFRTSYANGLRHIRRAFTLLPSIHAALRDDAYQPVRLLLKTGTNAVRYGRALAPETTVFVAMLGWEGDSLIFLPVPAEDLAAARPATMAMLPTSVDEAARRQRIMFREIATAWATAFPENPLALQALAISLDMLGSPAALDTLRRARSLARTEHESVEIAATEFWIRLRASLPSDAAGLRRAVALADSLLRLDVSDDSLAAKHLAGIATVTGRADLAARYARLSARTYSRALIPPSGPPFLVYAALGGPRDSIVRIEAQLRAEIERMYPPAQRGMETSRWVDRGASLAFPQVRVPGYPSAEAGGDYLTDAQRAWLRRDTTAVRRILTDLRAARTRMRLSDPTPDAVLPEATLFNLIGDSIASAEWLDGMLRTLGRSSPDLLADPVNGGAAVRAMALRAELARRASDRANERVWRSVVNELWGGADDFLRPVEDRQRTATSSR